MSDIEPTPAENYPEGLIRILMEDGASRAEVLDTALLMVWELLKDLDDIPPGPISNIYGFTTQEEAILKTAERLAGSAATLLGLLSEAEGKGN